VTERTRLALRSGFQNGFAESEFNHRPNSRKFKIRQCSLVELVGDVEQPVDKVEYYLETLHKLLRHVTPLNPNQLMPPSNAI
jgi:hypothetical protein